MSKLLILLLNILYIIIAETSKLPTNCGISQSTPFRIVSGEATKSGEFPWQIELNRRFTENGRNMIELCGGTLINEEWIMTAAHCVKKDHNPLNYVIHLGVHNRENLSGTIASKVSTIKIHPHYTENHADNDIALMKLHTPIDLQHSHIRPICLISSHVKVHSDHCYSSGWGRTASNGSWSQVLLKLHVNFVERETCNKVYGSIHETNICAKGTHSGSGICKGDSGGPLQCYDNGKWYQIGICSRGPRVCGETGHPDIYVSVVDYYNWIVDVIGSH